MEYFDFDDLMNFFLQLVRDSDFAYRDPSQNRLEFSWHYPDYDNRLTLDFWWNGKRLDVYFADYVSYLPEPRRFYRVNGFLPDWHWEQIHKAITQKHNAQFG